MKRNLILGIVTASSLMICSAAFAESGGWTFHDQQQVYQTAGQVTFDPSEITASIRPQNRNLAITNQNAPSQGRDLANTDDEH